MGKRSRLDQTVDQKDKNFYVTPYAGATPLLQFLPSECAFAEPCAGNGRLITHFERHGHKCVYAADAMPQAPGIIQRDAIFFDQPFPAVRRIITNPPWRRDLLHPMIDKFRQIASTWLLFDADWAYTAQASPYLEYCDLIVAVGRLKWFGDTEDSGKDNCSWYHFGSQRTVPQFIGIQQTVPQSILDRAKAF